jgi:hypothetical protein
LTFDIETSRFSDCRLAIESDGHGHVAINADLYEAERTTYLGSLRNSDLLRPVLENQIHAAITETFVPDGPPRLRCYGGFAAFLDAGARPPVSAGEFPHDQDASSVPSEEGSRNTNKMPPSHLNDADGVVLPRQTPPRALRRLLPVSWGRWFGSGQFSILIRNCGELSKSRLPPRIRTEN